MTQYFAEYGPRLVRLGYDTLPATGKAVFIDGWQSKLIDEAQVAKWAANGQAGKNVGVRTGALSAVDLDILDGAVCATVQADFEDRFGCGLQRVGRAPKRLMVYTASRPVKKMKAAWVDPNGVVHGVEILGAGQQFIAYGMHPDTGREYEWEGDSLLDLEAWEVPTLRVDEVAVWMRDVLPGLVPPEWELITKSSDLVEGGSHRSVSDPRLKAGLVGAVCRTWSISGAIAEFLGEVYAQTDQLDRYVYLHGTSKLGGAVVYDDDTYLMSNHNSDPASGKLRNVFDLLRIHMFGHLDDKDDPFHNETMGPSFDAMKAWAKGREDVLDELEHPMTTTLLRQLKAACGRRIEVSDEVVRGVLARVMWQPDKGRYYIARDPWPLDTRPADLPRFIGALMGDLFDADEVRAALTVVTPPAQLDKTLAAVCSAAWGVLSGHIRRVSCATRFAYNCDPFCVGEWSVVADGQVATFTYPWVPLAEGPEPLARHVEDYKAHFPELDAFLRLVAASRFAPTRKQAYVWMHCPSDWGKSFLLSALSGLGVVTATTMDEIKLMIKGSPCGRTGSDFYRSLVLAVDEFAGVVKETKLLTESIEISPKNQPMMSFPLYLKLFLSAESVPSLCGENGIEDQFANRFTKFMGKGSLASRPMFDADKGRYFASIQGYCARRLNALMGDYVSLGEAKAQVAADAEIKTWFEAHRIDKHATRLSEQIESLATEFSDWVVEQHMRGKLEGFIWKNGSGLYVTNPSRIISDWLKATMDESEQAMLRHKKDAIQVALGMLRQRKVRATETDTLMNKWTLAIRPSEGINEGEVFS